LSYVPASSGAIRYIPGCFLQEKIEKSLKKMVLVDNWVYYPVLFVRRIKYV